MVRCRAGGWEALELFFCHRITLCLQHCPWLSSSETLSGPGWRKISGRDYPSTARQQSCSCKLSSGISSRLSSSRDVSWDPVKTSGKVSFHFGSLIQVRFSHRHTSDEGQSTADKVLPPGWSELSKSMQPADTCLCVELSPASVHKSVTCMRIEN